MERLPMKRFSLISVLITCTIISNSAVQRHSSVDSGLNRDLSPKAQRTDYWLNLGQSTLSVQLNKNQLNKNVAKNIILFIGDGMSTATLTAARIYKKDTGDSTLAFDKFPYSGMAMTKCANSEVPESSCTSTAYLSGVQGNMGTIGLKSSVPYLDCHGQNNTENHTESIVKWAQHAGKRTGIVTTDEVVSASPGGTYAHSANRYWVNDQDIVNTGHDPNVCIDMTRQLIESSVGQKLNVIMGGGRSHFLPNTETDINEVAGKRGDGKNLLNQWQFNHRNDNATFVQTRDELLNISNDADYVLGLFNEKNMLYHLDSNMIDEPALDEMVSIALDILERGENGYFLFVEGGRIDHAHHFAKPVRAIDETIEFEKAIDLVRRRTNEEDTLVIVTADHSQTMLISGFSKIDSDTFYDKDRDGLNNIPYSTVVYTSGISSDSNTDTDATTEVKLTQLTKDDKDYIPVIAVVAGPKTYVHAVDDVTVYASGPWSHLFTGLYEQIFLPHGMAFAGCLGNGIKACDSLK